MEYINVGEKTFVKANKIARELGYTADYIGQLCRADKVEAKLVGRSWYVEESSIRAHKKNRYRSTKATTQKELRQAVSQTNPEPTTPPARETRTIHQAPLSGGKFYRHHRPTLVAPRYAQDDSELLPVVKKPIQSKPMQPKYVPISLADAETIRVANKEKETTFKATELPEVRFKGRLKVESAEDTEEPKEATVGAPEGELVETVPEPAPEPAPEPVVKKVVTQPEVPPEAHKVSVILDDKKRGEKIPVDVIETKPPVRPKKGTKQHLVVVEDEGAQDEVVAVHEEAEEQAVESEVRSVLLPVLFFLVVTSVSAFIGLCLLSVQGVIEVDQDTVTTSYEFDIWLGVEQIKLYLYSYLG